MCRMLLVSRQKSAPIGSYLSEFAHMCKKSPSPDGDWQGDGWGISWIDSSGIWQTYKDVLPIWKSHERFDTGIHSHIFLVHARSKSFQEDIVSTHYNQPFIKNGYAFVFNGQMHGVRIPGIGRNGAEKVLNLSLLFARKRERFLEKVHDQIRLTAADLVASNIIMTDGVRVHVLCAHNGKTSNYHTLYYIDRDDLLLICSQELSSNSSWKRIENGQARLFKALTKAQ